MTALESLTRVGSIPAALRSSLLIAFQGDGGVLSVTFGSYWLYVSSDKAASSTACMSLLSSWPAARTAGSDEAWLCAMSSLRRSIRALRSAAPSWAAQGTQGTSGGVLFENAFFTALVAAVTALIGV